MFNVTEIDIPLAPPREFLKIFGGKMTIEQFRKDSLCTNVEYNIIYPPMVSIVPILEEDVKNNNGISESKPIKKSSIKMANSKVKKTEANKTALESTIVKLKSKK